MPRIAPCNYEESSPEVRELIDTATNGLPTDNLMATVAKHPGLMRQWIRFGGKLLFRGKLPADDRELVILRVGWLTRSAYEWGQHVPIAANAGLSDELIEAVPRGSSSELWSDKQRVLLSATDQCVRDRFVDLPTWNRLADWYDEAQLIEFLFLAGHYAMVAGVLNTVGVEVDEDLRPLPTD